MRIGNAFAVGMTNAVLRGGSGAIPQILLANPATSALFELYLARCDVGFSASGGAVLVQPQGATQATVHIANSEVHNTTFGTKFDASATSAGIQATIDASEYFSFNLSAVTALAPGAGFARVLLARSTVVNAGGAAFYINGGSAIGLIYKHTLTGNATGVFTAGGATAYTFRNSDVFGNGGNVSGSLSGQPLQ